jgi:glycosyltransferase involved in cell wall biosynthesis
VHHDGNKGYGAALRSGMAAARMDHIFFTDGDGQFDVAELQNLLEHIGQADIVCGIRRHRQDNVVRRINSACWALLVQKMLRFRCPDVDCAFKLFRRRVLEGMTLKSTGAMISAEILARASRAGYTIKSLPVTHLPRLAGSATGARIGVIFKAFKELLRLRKDILSSNR